MDVTPVRRADPLMPAPTHVLSPEGTDVTPDATAVQASEEPVKEAVSAQDNFSRTAAAVPGREDQSCANWTALRKTAPCFAKNCSHIVETGPEGRRQDCCSEKCEVSWQQTKVNILNWCGSVPASRSRNATDYGVPLIAEPSSQEKARSVAPSGPASEDRPPLSETAPAENKQPEEASRASQHSLAQSAPVSSASEDSDDMNLIVLYTRALPARAARVTTESAAAEAPTVSEVVNERFSSFSAASEVVPTRLPRETPFPGMSSAAVTSQRNPAPPTPQPSRQGWGLRPNESSEQKAEREAQESREDYEGQSDERSHREMSPGESDNDGARQQFYPCPEKEEVEQMLRKAESHSRDSSLRFTCPVAVAQRSPSRYKEETQDFLQEIDHCTKSGTPMLRCSLRSHCLQKGDQLHQMLAALPVLAGAPKEQEQQGNHIGSAARQQRVNNKKKEKKARLNHMVPAAPQTQVREQVPAAAHRTQHRPPLSTMPTNLRVACEQQGQRSSQPATGAQDAGQTVTMNTHRGWGSAQQPSAAVQGGTLNTHRSWGTHRGWGSAQQPSAAVQSGARSQQKPCRSGYVIAKKKLDRGDIPNLEVDRNGVKTMGGSGWTDQRNLPLQDADDPCADRDSPRDGRPPSEYTTRSSQGDRSFKDPHQAAPRNAPRQSDSWYQPYSRSGQEKKGSTAYDQRHRRPRRDSQPRRW